MRLVASFLLCVAAVSATAAEIYRWKDANGVIHYTDYPVAGAERVRSTPPPPPSGSAAEAPPLILPNVVTPATPAAPFRYTQCRVASPRNEQSFFGVQPVSIQLDVQPALQANHRIQVAINGVPVSGWPETAASYTLPEVVRGSHTVEVTVADANGRVLCRGPLSTFFLQQPSVLSPLNPNNPANQRPPTAPRPPVTPPKSP